MGTRPQTRMSTKTSTGAPARRRRTSSQCQLDAVRSVSSLGGSHGRFYRTGGRRPGVGNGPASQTGTVLQEARAGSGGPTGQRPAAIRGALPRMF